MCEVVVSTGARLHFGLFGMNSELPLQFGGLGMMVETPGVTVVARPATELQVTAPSDVTRRVEMFARRAISHMPQLPPAALHVTRHIPSHRGLGSGTQLALAAVAAMCELSGVQASATELAAAAGRGERSAIGIHGFRRGGFLLDHGHAPGRFSQEIAARAAVPADWRVVLVCPNDVEGLSGPPEREAFSRLGPMSVAETQALHRHAETQVLPGSSAVFLGSDRLHPGGQRSGCGGRRRSGPAVL